MLQYRATTSSVLIAIAWRSVARGRGEDGQEGGQEWIDDAKKHDPRAWTSSSGAGIDR